MLLHSVFINSNKSSFLEMLRISIEAERSVPSWDVLLNYLDHTLRSKKAHWSVCYKSVHNEMLPSLAVMEYIQIHNSCYNMDERVGNLLLS